MFRRDMNVNAVEPTEWQHHHKYFQKFHNPNIPKKFIQLKNDVDNNNDNDKNNKNNNNKNNNLLLIMFIYFLNQIK